MTEGPMPSGERRWLGIILVLAGVLRVCSLLAASTLPSFTHHRLDALLYHEAGRAFAAGDLALGRSVLHMSPLYCALVGGSYALFGDGPWAVRLLQLGLGLLTVACTAATARRMFGARAGLAAALALALYGPLVFYEAQIAVVTLSTSLISLLLWWVVRLLQSAEARPRAWFGAGAVAGLCVLARPNALLFAAPLAFACWRGMRTAARGRRLACAAALALGGALVVAPVTLRNRVVAGEWVLVTDSGGMNFYIGNGAGANGTFRVPPELPDASNAPQQFVAFRAFAERSQGRALSSREVDAFYYDRAFQQIRNHPQDWLRLLLEKAWLFWNQRELPNTDDYAFTRLLNPVLGLPLLQFALLSPFALLGLFTLSARRRSEDQFVALVAWTQFAALIAYFVLAHYRAPAVPALTLCALSGLLFLRDAIAERRAPQAIGACLLLAGMLPLTLAPKLEKAFDDEWFKLGYSYHLEGDAPHAEQAYLRALALNPENISAHKNLATLYQSGGARGPARVHWEAVRMLAQREHREGYQQQAARALRELGDPAPTRR